MIRETARLKASFRIHNLIKLHLNCSRLKHDIITLYQNKQSPSLIVSWFNTCISSCEEITPLRIYGREFTDTVRTQLNIKINNTDSAREEKWEKLFKRFSERQPAHSC